MKINPRLFLVIGAIAALAVAAYFLPLTNWSLAFVHWVHGFGKLGVAIYFVAYVAGTVFFFPGIVLTTGAGFLYGPIWGTLLVSPASVLGASIAFFLARSVARGWVGQRLTKYPKFEAMDRAVEKRGFRMVFLLRLSGVFIPFSMMNYALGLTRVSFRDYVLASWIGMLPETILYVYLGSAAQDLTQLMHGKQPGEGPWPQVIFWGGLAATAVLVILIARIARQAMQPEMGNQGGTVGDKISGRKEN